MFASAFEMQAVFSPMPETETFSTPPSTPTVADNNILDRPSLSRRNSRPSNLRISQSAANWTPGVVVDNQPSPDTTMSTKVPTPSTAVPPLNGAHANGYALHQPVGCVILGPGARGEETGARWLLVSMPLVVPLG